MENLNNSSKPAKYMKPSIRIIVFSTLILTLAFAFCPSSCFSEIPRLINYQGKLTDSNGAPVTETKSITFKIYNVVSGGIPLWEETRSVTINKGIFNVLLGSSTDLNLAFDEPYYLGVQITGDSEMTPRQRITSSAYAIRSETANNLRNGIPFYIAGLELEYANNRNITVAPGALDINGEILLNPNCSPLIDIGNDSNYIQGRNNPNPWIYAYLYNNNGQIGYVLADVSPNISKRYYIQNEIVYRCIGVLRTGSGNKSGNILKFYQSGDWFYYEDPQVGYYTPNSGIGDQNNTWTNTGTMPYIPLSITRMAKIYLSGCGISHTRVRTKGSSATCQDNTPGIYLGATSGGEEAQSVIPVIVDANGELQYKTHTNSGMGIKICGFHLGGIR